VSIAWLAIFVLHAGAASANNPAPAPAAQPERYALLIGINQYAQPTNPAEAVSALKGPENDVKTMVDLLTHYHFQNDNEHMMRLIGPAATHAAIQAAFKSQLIDKAAQHPGAIIVFYFSGHGSQENIQDVVPHDTREHDTLVAYDSRASNGDDILDNELISWFEELRTHTSNITFILDSCHSGAEIRNLDTLVSREIPPNPKHDLTGELPAGGQHYPAGPDFGLTRRQQFSLLSASLDYESSYEDQIQTDTGPVYHGFFTYYLYQALLQQPDRTNQEAVSVVRQALRQISPNQHPQAVGNVEGKVFGGSGDRDDPFVPILSLGANNTFEIRAGAPQGVHEGAFLAVYAPTAQRLVGEADKVANARITSVRSSSSTAQLSDTPKQPITTQDKVAIVTPFSGFEGLAVRLYDFPNQNSTASERQLLSSVSTGLAKNKLVTVATPGKRWDIGVQKGGCVLGNQVFAATDKRSRNPACSSQYYLADSKGDVPLLGFHVASSDPNAVANIVNAVELSAKQANIRALDNSVSPLRNNVVIKLQPVNITPTDGTTQPDIVPQGQPVNDGYQPLTIGRHFELVIYNNSDKTLFCGVLMLGTSGSVKLISSNNGDRLLAHTSEVTFPPRDVGPPLGIETYKVIATTDPGVDFTLMEQPGAKGLGESPLQWLLRQTSDFSVRDSSANANLDLNLWTTTSLDILVQNP
jgi:hypothetical protein